MNDDEKVTVIGDKHDTRYELDGSATKVRHIRFYIGRRGPFIETFEDATYSAQQFRDRVEALRRTMADMVR